MKIIKYFGMLAAIAALASCSSNDEMLPAWQADGDAVHIQASVGGVATRTNPLGADSLAQTRFNNGDKIRVTSDSITYVTYALNNGQWIPEGSSFLKWTSPTMKFMAYYPVNDSTTFERCALPSDQSTLDKITQADFMLFYGYADRPASGSDLNLQFSRMTARVIVKITKFAEEYTQGEQYIKNLFIGTVSHKAYNVDLAGPKNEMIGSLIKPYATNLDAQGNGVLHSTYTALVSPAIIGSSVPLISLVDGKGHILTIGSGLAYPSYLMQGMSYTFNITIGKKQISIDSVVVTNWKGEVIDGGQANEDTSKRDGSVTGITGQGNQSFEY